MNIDKIQISPDDPEHVICDEKLTRWFDSMSKFCGKADDLFDSKVSYIGGGAIVLAIYWASHLDQAHDIHSIFWGIGLMTGAVLLHLGSPIAMKACTMHFVNIIRKYRNHELPQRPNEVRQHQILYRVNAYISILCFCLLAIGAVLILINIYKSI